MRCRGRTQRIFISKISAVRPRLDAKNDRNYISKLLSQTGIKIIHFCNTSLRYLSERGCGVCLGNT